MTGLSGILGKLLRALGFCEEWVNHVMACVSSISQKVKINGEVSSLFLPQRGLRQSDPLFIIISEVLSLLINNAIDSKCISSIKLSRSFPSLPYPTYYLLNY